MRRGELTERERIANDLVVRERVRAAALGACWQGWSRVSPRERASILAIVADAASSPPGAAYALDLELSVDGGAVQRRGDERNRGKPPNSLSKSGG